MFKSTSQHKRYWKKRKINWQASYFNPDHPHRDLLIKSLRDFKFASLLELGCAAGANLFRVQKAFPNVQVGGIDVNPEAIECAKQNISGDQILEVGSAEDIFHSDKSADITLADMSLIYIGPFKINKVMKEIKRVTRKGVLLCEFSSKSFLKRQILRLATGYNAYNWPKLLEKHGFYDIVVKKIPESAWPGGEPQKTFGYIISAKI